jgi:hypothetical protein
VCGFWHLVFRAIFFGLIFVLDESKVLLRQYGATLAPPPLILLKFMLKMLCTTGRGGSTSIYGYSIKYPTKPKIFVKKYVYIVYNTYVYIKKKLKQYSSIWATIKRPSSVAAAPPNMYTRLNQ